MDDKPPPYSEKQETSPPSKAALNTVIHAQDVSAPAPVAPTIILAPIDATLAATSTDYKSSEHAIVTQPQPQPSTATSCEKEQYPSNTCAVVLSCVVCWLCCCPLGLLAFYLAVKARESVSPAEARRRIGSAYALCLSGFLIGLVIYALELAVRVIIHVNSTPFWLEWE